MATKTQKTETPMKLINILKQTEADFIESDLNASVKQADINTQQEILDLESNIIKLKQDEARILRGKPFSASKLYSHRKEVKLLEMKLEEIKAIKEELF